jgi:hypothetical protein
MRPNGRTCRSGRALHERVDIGEHFYGPGITGCKVAAIARGHEDG